MARRRPALQPITPPPPLPRSKETARHWAPTRASKGGAPLSPAVRPGPDWERKCSPGTHLQRVAVPGPALPHPGPCSPPAWPPPCTRLPRRTRTAPAPQIGRGGSPQSAMMTWGPGSNVAVTPSKNTHTEKPNTLAGLPASPPEPCRQPALPGAPPGHDLRSPARSRARLGRGGSPLRPYIVPTDEDRFPFGKKKSIKLLHTTPVPAIPSGSCCHDCRSWPSSSSKGQRLFGIEG
jgi:hypothetical protein